MFFMTNTTNQKKNILKMLSKIKFFGFITVPFRFLGWFLIGFIGGYVSKLFENFFRKRKDGEDIQLNESVLEDLHKEREKLMAQYSQLQERLQSALDGDGEDLEKIKIKLRKIKTHIDRIERTVREIREEKELY